MFVWCPYSLDYIHLCKTGWTNVWVQENSLKFSRFESALNRAPGKHMLWATGTRQRAALQFGLFCFCALFLPCICDLYSLNFMMPSMLYFAYLKRSHKMFWKYILFLRHKLLKWKIVVHLNKTILNLSFAYI